MERDADGAGDRHTAQQPLQEARPVSDPPRLDPTGGAHVVKEKILMRLLEDSGALRRGHFLLSSGLHSEAYVQCALLLEDPVRARQVGQDLAEELRSFHPDSVLAPAL